MNTFLMRHPFVGLVMFGLLCATIVQTADVVANGTRVEHLRFKKINKEENVESVEE